MNVSEDKNKGVETYSLEDIYFLVYYYGTFLIIMCINIPGNILVIFAVTRNASLKQPCNYYIASLAFSDLLVGFVYPLYNISHLEFANFSTVLGRWSVCRIIVTEVLALEICTSYHLVAITTTRYFAIVYPFRYHIYVTDKSTLVSIAAIWLLSQGTSIALYTVYEPENYVGICRYELIFPVTYVGILLVLQLLLPLCIMVGLYVPIVRIARKQAKVMAIQENGSNVLCRNGNQNVFKREIKSTIMVSILLGFFTLSWLPVIVYFFVSVSCNGCYINHYIRASVRILLYLNSAVNVFIYAGRLSDFRIYFWRYWRRCCNGSRREHRKQNPSILPSVTAIVNSYTSTKRPHHDFQDRMRATSIL